MKWRKFKKRFKKHELSRMIGLTVFEPMSNAFYVITDVKIKPKGGKKVDYMITAKNAPDYSNIFTTPDSPNGFAHSFDLSMDVPNNKNLQKLLNNI